MTNPLTQYFRTPKLYTALPSQGMFYPEDFLETSINGELAIYPLSALDQILLKTPDALLNGESLLKVIKNCVPGVKDVKLLVEPDIKTLLLAIKIATSGPTANYDLECSECKAQNSFDVNINNLLESVTETDLDPTISVNDELVIRVRPYNFEQRNLQILNELEESKTLRLIDSNTDLDDSQKMNEVAKHVEDMANRTFDLVAKSIVSITIRQTNEIVTDTGFIQEYLKGISKTQATIIMDKIKELNDSGPDTVTRFKCESCGHEWDQQLDFDPISFFG